MPFLGFEWEGEYFHFTVLPFGLSTAPWLFTKVISHCVRFLRSPGMSLGILSYLDKVIFAARSAREALCSAQILINVLRRFGWLIHPTKCVGATTATQVFQALGTIVDLATQTFSVSADTVRRILTAARSLATGPLKPQCDPSPGSRALYPPHGWRQARPRGSEPARSTP